MAGHLQWEVMAPYVTWLCLSGAPGGRFRILVQVDFEVILPQYTHEIVGSIVNTVHMLDLWTAVM